MLIFQLNQIINYECFYQKFSEKGKIGNFQKLIIKYNSKIKFITLIFISFLFINKLNIYKMN